jgi:hypothetical protein
MEMVQWAVYDSPQSTSAQAPVLYAPTGNVVKLGISWRPS